MQCKGVAFGDKLEFISSVVDGLRAVPALDIACYVVTFVKHYFCWLVLRPPAGALKELKTSSSPALATLLYADWIPLGQWSAASSTV